MKSLLISCMLLSLVACKTTSARVDTPVTRAGDPAVEGQLACRGALGVSESRGEKSIDCELVNTGDSKLDFVYTIDWFDKRGNALEPAQRKWNRASLGSDDHAAIRATAPSLMAVAWRLRALRPDQIR